MPSMTVQQRASLRPRVLALATLAVLCTPAFADGQFTTIPGIPGYGWTGGSTPPANPNQGDLRGYNSIVVSAISADGSSVAGTHSFQIDRYGFYRGCQLLCYAWLGSSGGSQAFVWNGQSSSGLGYPSNATGVLRSPAGIADRPGYGTRESVAAGISADGLTIAGYGRTGCVGACPNPSEPYRAFIWTATGGMRDIEGLSPTASTRAHGVSGDGSTVVGGSGDQAFVWTASTGTRELRGLVTGRAMATAASFDGAWIIGESAAVVGGSSTVRATLWDREGRAVDLGAVGGSSFSFGTDISFDGNVAVGYGFADGNAIAFRWTREGGIVSLGYVAGQSGSVASAVSGNGQVVVGYSGFTPGGISAGVPFRWTQHTGMQSVAAWLASGGVQLPSGVSLLTATDTNYNGNVVVGTYQNTNDPPYGFSFLPSYGYLARVGDAGSGFIADLHAFRSGVYEAGMHTLDNAALLPGMAMATAGRQGGWNAMAMPDADRGCGWASAQRTRYRDGGPELDAQEVGACLDAGPVRLAVGGGRLQAKQAWSLAGGADFDGRYTLAGAVLPIGERFEASLTGYRGRFDANVSRRYRNGAGIDASSARPEGDFLGAVARVDWRDAARRGRVGVSPYLAYAWSETELDAVTETDGGFPVAYGEASVDLREVTLGALAEVEVARGTSLGLGLESTRRRVDTGDGMAAQVVGLFDVSMPGGRGEDTVSHGVLEVRHAFGPGTTLRANARASLGGDRRATDVALQLHQAF